ANASTETDADGCSDEAKFPDPAFEPDWRDQVAAKVTSYKSRRPRKERYPSLQLQFESAANSAGRSPRQDQDPNTLTQCLARQAMQLHAAPAISTETTPRVIE